LIHFKQILGGRAGVVAVLSPSKAELNQGAECSSGKVIFTLLHKVGHVTRLNRGIEHFNTLAKETA
jgi:hypothetical protein